MNFVTNDLSCVISSFIFSSFLHFFWCYLPFFCVYIFRITRRLIFPKKNTYISCISFMLLHKCFTKIVKMIVFTIWFSLASHSHFSIRQQGHFPYFICFGLVKFKTLFDQYKQHKVETHTFHKWLYVIIIIHLNFPIHLKKIKKTQFHIFNESHERWARRRKKTNKQIHPMPKYIWRNKKKDEPISGNRDNKPISGNHKKDEHWVIIIQKKKGTLSHS